MKSEPMQHVLMTSFHRQAHNSERRSFGIMSSSPTSSSSFGGTAVPVAAVAGVQAPSTTSASSNPPRATSPSSSIFPSSSTFSPDLQAQRNSLEHLLDRKLAEGDFWYVIVAEWLENLKRFVGLNSSRKYYGQRASSPPGPIVTRRDYAHTVDVVHEDAWRMLVKWYGLADGHKAMKLVVYKYARGPEIEHNINSFKVSLSNSPPEDFHIVRFSKMEKIGHIEHKVRQLYAIPQNSESRLWAKADTDGDWRPLLCRDKPIGVVLDIDSDFTRPVVVLETCDLQGKWSGAPEPAEVPSEESTNDNNCTSVGSSSGFLVENSLFDDVTTSWELDIHDHIEQVGKMFLEKLHGNFDVFVQKGKDYIVGRECQLRERERMVCARESVTERLASRLEAKEVRLTEGMEKCEEKIKEYENMRLELEREFLEKQEEAEKVLNEKRDELKKEAEDLQTSRDNFQMEVERMTELGRIQESRIKLDIGGNQFTTSQLTLSKDSDSMLAAMFSGRHELKTEADGSYFIDRDGTHFRYILNYLRDGCIKEGTLPQNNDTVYRELLTEAEFYQLEDLADFLREKLIHKECG